MHAYKHAETCPALQQADTVRCTRSSGCLGSWQNTLKGSWCMQIHAQPSMQTRSATDTCRYTLSPWRKHAQSVMRAETRRYTLSSWCEHNQPLMHADTRYTLSSWCMQTHVDARSAFGTRHQVKMHELWAAPYTSSFVQVHWICMQVNFTLVLDM
jgi:hypothetical protein